MRKQKAPRLREIDREIDELKKQIEWVRAGRAQTQPGSDEYKALRERQNLLTLKLNMACKRRDNVANKQPELGTTMTEGTDKSHTT